LVMSRVAVVDEGGSEGANSCAELTVITEHSYHRVGSLNSVEALSIADLPIWPEKRDDIDINVLDNR
jgi:hypothetical protein